MLVGRFCRRFFYNLIKISKRKLEIKHSLKLKEPKSVSQKKQFQAQNKMVFNKAENKAETKRSMHSIFRFSNKSRNVADNLRVNSVLWRLEGMILQHTTFAIKHGIEKIWCSK